MQTKIKYEPLSNISISFDDTFVDDERIISQLRGAEHNHYHNVFEIILSVESSKNLVCLDDVPYPILQNQMILIAPNSNHRIDYEPASRYMRYVLHFSLPYVDSLLKTLDGTAPVLDFSNFETKVITLNNKEFSNACALFANLLKCYRLFNRANTPVNELSLRLNLANTLISVHKFYSASRTQDIKHLSTDSQFKDIILYLNDNFTQQITLEMLSSKFYMSKPYISHKFRDITGVTFIEYLHCMRIAESQRLLSGGDVDVSRIYEMCGFNNIQHFYRTFKKLVGMSPGAYSKMAHVLREDTGSL